MKNLLVAGVSLLICCDYALARTWTDVKGRSLEAEIVGKSDQTVDLKLSSGKTVTIKTATLSQKDREFVANWAPKTADKDALGGDIERYFSSEWPRLISADVGMEIDESRGDEGEFIYTSPHYEFISNAELSKSVVKRFALLFEATYLYVKALPLGNSKAHVASGQRYKIYLFEKMEQYYRAGGPVGSAGVFMGGKEIIMVPFRSLGLIKGSSSWRVDYDRTNKTLPHEITHQITDREYYAQGARGWYTEGLAEYVAATPYRSGKFSVNAADRAIEQYVTGFSRSDNRGRNLGTDIKAPDLKQFMDQSYASFTGGNGNYNYGFSALLVTYFCHYDGDEDAANLKNFLRALKAGKKGAEAQKELLAGRSWDELEAEISKGWSRRGVKIEFK
ncbi:hypothetical protein JIN77_12665 [Verrucomicrobiaceae bacterium R5-34]|uniref:SLA1 homology domain-containing protein n=1 Tax=Oceaniferula flava TaxID=2800421 RepID=A0AAE2SA67_9BACT|nr:hypothetical protein [Oceaniferula flavus]MBK1831585.1 hypothetical protein [Verrucomicrobiaceae bacterium R5-34]MBK1854078.1 hypothetical protein [Oceaniferula flavus]MBM1135384.1 hypothetical protein [Oceaniferula flavus]